MSQTKVQRLFIADKTSLMHDLWRVNTAASITSAFLTSNWERSDQSNFAQVGTGMTESSGVFSFPSTGVYLVRFHATGYKNNESRYIGAHINVSTDNFSSDSNTRGVDYTSVSGDTSANYWYSTTSECTVDCTDTSNVKVKFYLDSIAQVSLQASSTQNYTYALFARLGDT